MGSAALTNVRATDLITFQSMLRANDELPVRGPRVMERVRDHQGRLHDELPAAAAGLKYLTLESRGHRIKLGEVATDKRPPNCMREGSGMDRRKE